VHIYAYLHYMGRPGRAWTLGGIKRAGPRKFWEKPGRAKKSTGRAAIFRPVQGSRGDDTRDDGLHGTTRCTEQSFQWGWCHHLPLFEEPTLAINFLRAAGLSEASHVWSPIERQNKIATVPHRFTSGGGSGGGCSCSSSWMQINYDQEPVICL